MKLAYTVSSEIKKGYRFVKTKIANSVKFVENTKTAFPPGFDAKPINGLLAIVANSASNEEPVIVGYLNPKAIDDLNLGDSRIFATNDNGDIVSSIIMRANGTTEILGTGDFLVRYSKLEEAYNETNSKLNDLITAFNSHVHATAAVGPPVPPTPVPDVIPAIPSTGDITGAKIEEAKTI